VAAQDARECRLRVGDAVIALECPSPGYAASLDRYFDVTGSVGDPDIRLRLNIVAHGDVEAIPDSLFATKRVDADGFSMADGLVRGRFDPGCRSGEVWVDCILTKGQVTRVFEQILYQAFYSARAARRYDAFLIHSSAVVRGGAGFLFVGPSGTGKTTVAHLSRADLVLNDEVTLVSFEEGAVVVHGTPFNGYFREKSAGRAPLRAVLLLAHGPSHRLGEATRVDAVAALTREIVPPMGLEDAWTPAVRAAMLDLADRLSGSVPVRRLEFRPDPDFWQELDRAFLTPGR